MDDYMSFKACQEHLTWWIVYRLRESMQVLMGSIFECISDIEKDRVSMMAKLFHTSDLNGLTGDNRGELVSIRSQC